MKLPDHESRHRCLTDFDSILAVEAAAGTGKTSLLAGRVVMLLASGRPPSEIAAITYTELAAGELAKRIQHTIEALLVGIVPAELEACFPAGVDAVTRANLAAASGDLDGITVATIHGFCKIIISDHAVAAGIDPGVTVADEAVAANLLDDAFVAWLKAALDGDTPVNEPIAEMCRRDPREAVALLRRIVGLRLEHRTARATAPDLEARPDIELCDAIDDFARWVAANPHDEWTTKLANQFAILRQFYFECFAEVTFARLWDLANPPRLDFMVNKSARFAEYKREAAWKDLLGDLEGPAKADEAKRLIGIVEAAFASLLGEIGIRLVDAVSARLDGVFERYEEAKARAAVMDFQDLLIHAHGLVTGHEDVRTSVGNRFRRILVDEFQDTDPLQCEILFAIGAASGKAIKPGASLRSGALFFVGDPKQAIYRFRGADIATYTMARQAVVALDNGASLHITSNFRSARPIVEFVNDRFAPVFRAPVQPAYVPLSATLDGISGVTHVAKITLDEGIERAGVNAIRDEEAALIARFCKELISGFDIRLPDGSMRRAKPGDIALLAPSHTELWRYERALEAERIQVASQASKALVRRQETQDVLALLRALSDGADRLAFGALMRGPLVGLTDTELLDITSDLNEGGAIRTFFGIDTDPILVKDDYARSVLETLQSLRRRRHSTTPAILLSEAIEALAMRLILASRYKNKNAQALANLDALVESARRYSISGLERFVDDLQDQWERVEQIVEGRIDASEEAVQIVSMHSCKGLEWPIVIPINSVTGFRSAETFVRRRSDNTLHWVLAGVRPPHLEAAMQEEQEGDARERERLMYVACTRARDLLVLPLPPARDNSTWTGVVDLRIGELPTMDTSSFGAAIVTRAPAAPNDQTVSVFSEQSETVATSVQTIVWRQPSAHDPTKFRTDNNPPSEADEVRVVDIPVGVGLDRGSLLHKLMEELLTGELEEDDGAIVRRSTVLAEQLRAATGKSQGTAPLAEQLARTALQTLAIPEIAALRPYLVPEVSVWASEGADVLIGGRADCLIVGGDEILGVIDWKSDVAPSDELIDGYAEQVRKYMEATGSPVGLICFMTHQKLVWLGDGEALFDKISGL